tara:strand:+ start:230 stop:1069 length:840 start_codon:yes stop_codon:yes gene_type:complete
MLGQKFYNGILRKYIVMFGTLFNDIEIDREQSGIVKQTLRVPVNYGPSQKYLVRTQEDPTLRRKVAIQLPRMSFEMTGFQYDASRRLNPTRKFAKATPGSINKIKSVYTPTPFDISFELSIMVKNEEDGIRIIEQIIPFFTPEYTVSMKLMEDLDYPFDIPVILNQFTTDDQYEGDFETRRALVHKLDFSVKGYLFGPISSNANIITLANTNIFEDINTTSTFNTSNANPIDGDRIVITPGMDANNNATTNASITVDRSLIDIEANSGIIIARTDIDND